MNYTPAVGQDDVPVAASLAGETIEARFEAEQAIVALSMTDSSELVTEVIDVEPAAKEETDLVSLVLLYAIIGGYSGALVGLFTPIFVVLAMSFSFDSFFGGLIAILLYGVLGAIVWVPVAIVLGIIAGIGGLVLGLGVGLGAAVLYRLVYKNPTALRISRYLMAILNAGVFGYAAYWGYTHTFLYTIFPEFSLLPGILGFLGALSGLVMGLVGPEKAAESEPLNDEDAEVAMKVFAAPFQLWRGVASRSFNASIETIDDALKANEDPYGYPKISRYEREKFEREMKDFERMQKKQERAIKEGRHLDWKLNRGEISYKDYQARQEQLYKD